LLLFLILIITACLPYPDFSFSRPLSRDW